MAELQAELERRVKQLSESNESLESYDCQIVALVDEQIDTIASTRNVDDLKFLKRTLTSRTEQQLKELEQRKQSLTLNLKRISPINSAEATYNTSTNSYEQTSSDTYHTAASSCSTTQQQRNIIDGIEKMMSDSGVELIVTNKPDDDDEEETDSSNDEYNKVNLIISMITFDNW